MSDEKVKQYYNDHVGVCFEIPHGVSRSAVYRNGLLSEACSEKAYT